MKKYRARTKKWGVIVSIAIALLCILSYGLSWLITCGLVKLIGLCFGFAFSWKIATGVWLVVCLIKFIFPSNKNSDK